MALESLVLGNDLRKRSFTVNQWGLELLYLLMGKEEPQPEGDFAQYDRNLHHRASCGVLLLRCSGNQMIHTRSYMHQSLGLLVLNT